LVRTIYRRYDAAGRILLALGLLLASCSGQNDSQGPESSKNREDVQAAEIQPVMVFDTLIHDFGTIVEGEQVLCYFGYTNGGGEDLLITSVEASCGCTTPSWSEEPLGPGERGSLEIIFDTSGRSGIQRKVVTVMSNAANQVVRLTIRADVENSIN
jgi:hypothetical protein